MEADITQQNTAHEDSFRTAAKYVYFVLMTALTSGYIYLILWGIEINTIPASVLIIRCVTAVLAIWLGRLWKDKGFRLLLLFLIYGFIRIWISVPEHIFTASVSQYLLSGFWLCAGCYGLARTLNKKEIRTFLSINAILLTIGMLVYSGVGLYVAWTDQFVHGPGSEGWLNDGRLNLIYRTATASGSVINIAVMTAFGLYVCSSKRWTKGVLLPVLFMLLLTLSLTDSRTAFISTGMGFGIWAGIRAFSYFRRKNKQPAYSWLCAVLITAGVSVITVVAVEMMTPAFNAIKIRGGMILSNARAEIIESNQKVMSNRGFLVEGSVYSSGRFTLWQNIVAYLKDNPASLLFGCSAENPLHYVQGAEGYAHTHNIILQTVMENGILGSIPMFCFVGFVIARCIKLIRTRTAEKWLLYMPAIIGSILIGETVECFTWFRSSQCPMSAYLFIAMGLVVVFENQSCINALNKCSSISNNGRI